MWPATAILLALLACGGWPPAVSAEEKEDFAVVGYIPEWRYDGIDWDATFKHLTHALLFSIEVDPKGALMALDRLPKPEAMAAARAASDKHGTKLLICIGGNARSAGFSHMVRSQDRRSSFIAELKALMEKHGLHGVDYNWEYPNSPEDWDGLGYLLTETRAMLGDKGVMTMAYYPDGRQEMILQVLNATGTCDLLHSMAYDQPGKHSVLEFALKSIRNWKQTGQPAIQNTLGLPFYSRNRRTGEWLTYEDILKKHKPAWDVDEVGLDYFNGMKTIMQKVKLAKDHALGGVMIWEVGQDTHPDDPKSLLRAITAQRAITEQYDDPFAGVKSGTERPAQPPPSDQGRDVKEPKADSGRVSPKMAQWKDAHAKKMKEHLDKAKERGELPPDKEEL